MLLSRLPRATRWALGVLAVLVIASVASTPRDAQAAPPLPVGGLVDVGVDLVTGGVGNAAVEGFGALLGKLFSWSAEIINRRLLSWLVSVPDYAITPQLERRARRRPATWPSWRRRRR